MADNADNVILEHVKRSLTILDDFSDAVLLQKIAEAKEFLAAQGVSDTQIKSALGTAAITIFVSDTWTVGGEVKYSDALMFNVSRLYSNSLVEAKGGGNAT